jgi:two-component system LytT family response regulator
MTYQENTADLMSEKSTKNEQVFSKIILKNNEQKIILPSMEGFVVVELSEIIRCEACNNYTTFYFNDGKTITVSKPLNNYEKILAQDNFARVHNKHLVNLKYIKKYVKGKGGYLIMNDNNHVYVSAGKKKEFLKQIREYAKSV